MEFGDGVKGGPLNRTMVTEARRLEMAYVNNMGVYTKVPREEARKSGTRVITTKWVDTNKGSEIEPNYRSRLVGRELNLSERPDLFAATPPRNVLHFSSAGVPRFNTGNGPTGSYVS